MAAEDSAWSNLKMALGWMGMADGLPSSTSVARQTVAGAAWIIAWRVATRNLGLVSTLILVRLLQPSDFGLVSMATGLIASVDSLSAIGVQDALVRAGSPDRDMYDTGFTLSVLRGLATAVAIALIASPVGRFFDEPRLTVVMLALSIGILIGAAENIGIVNFRRDLAFSREFTLNFWPRVAGVALTVTAAAVWHSYWALVAGLLFGRAIRLPLTYWMSSYRPRFSLRAWRHLWAFSLWTWAQTVLYQARERSDAIVVGGMLGAPQVGILSIGLELGSLPITELAEPLNRALFSGFASLQNVADGLGYMFRGALGLGFLLILPAGFGISMVADPMVRLTLGDQWVAAVPVVQIVAIAGITAVFTQSCGTLLNALGCPHITFYTGAASTALKVLGLLVLVPNWGLRGAAVALWISSIADVLMYLPITLPRIQTSLKQLAACIIRPVVSTTAMVTVLTAFDMAWTPSAAGDGAALWADLAIRLTVGGACYFVVLSGVWLAVGRPDGAEHFAVAMLRNGFARITSYI